MLLKMLFAVDTKDCICHLRVYTYSVSLKNMADERGPKFQVIRLEAVSMGEKYIYIGFFLEV